MSDLASELERRQERPKVRDVAELIERMRPALIKSLQSEATADVLARHYLTALRLEPLLLECNPESLLAALLLSAQVRLEPGPLGHVYLIPYKRECTWVLGYTGILELARRSERVAALSSNVVYEGDTYEAPWQDEKGTHYLYRPLVDGDRGAPSAVLVTWRERIGGSWIARALHVGPERVQRARDASPAARTGTGPWLTDVAAMWAKTGIRAARPWLPLTADAGYAFASDERRAVRVEVDELGAAQPVLEDSPDE